MDLHNIYNIDNKKKRIHFEANILNASSSD